MAKRARFLAGALVGAGVQYMYDPRAGKSRRARLRDQALARLRRVGRMLMRRARFQRGRLQGRLHDATH